MATKKLVVLIVIAVILIIAIVGMTLWAKHIEKVSDHEFNQQQRDGCRAARVKEICPRECTKCWWNVRQKKGKRYLRSSGEMVNDTFNQETYRIVR